MQKAAGANATVTVCHSRTRDIGAVTRSADIIVMAIGQADFLKADMVRPGQTVNEAALGDLISAAYHDVRRRIDGAFRA